MAEKAETQFPLAPFLASLPLRRAMPWLIPMVPLPPTFLGSGGAKAGSLGCDAALKYRLLRLPRSVCQCYSVLLNPPLCPLWNNGWDFASWFMLYSQPLGRMKVKPHMERGTGCGCACMSASSSRGVRIMLRIYLSDASSLT